MSFTQERKYEAKNSAQSELLGTHKICILNPHKIYERFVQGLCFYSIFKQISKKFFKKTPKNLVLEKSSSIFKQIEERNEEHERKAEKI